MPSNYNGYYHQPQVNPPFTGMRQEAVYGEEGQSRMNEAAAPGMPGAYRPTVGPAYIARDEMAGCSMPLAMAWFEDQRFGSIYNPEHGMNRGTLFPELDKPWLPTKGGR